MNVVCRMATFLLTGICWWWPDSGRLLCSHKSPCFLLLFLVLSLQPDGSYYGDDLLSGQIHFVDTRGNRKLLNADGQNIGSEQNCPDIRFGNKKNRTVIYYCLTTEQDQGFDKDFHIYELEWSPSMLTVTIIHSYCVTTVISSPSFHVKSDIFRLTNC